jgi:hypothetical protein
MSVPAAPGSDPAAGRSSPTTIPTAQITTPTTTRNGTRRPPGTGTPDLTTSRIRPGRIPKTFSTGVIGLSPNPSSRVTSSWS